MVLLSSTSKQILNTDELSLIKNIFENQYSQIESDEQIFEFLGLQAYCKIINVIINIRISILPNQTNTFFYLISLPINKP